MQETANDTRELRRGKRLLEWFISSDEFEYWRHDHLGNDLCLTDPERFDRIMEYAEDGADGSTHAECIQDWRDAWSSYLQNRNAWTHPEHVDNAMQAAIDDCEAWHERNGSLWQVIG